MCVCSRKFSLCFVLSNGLIMCSNLGKCHIKSKLFLSLFSFDFDCFDRLMNAMFHYFVNSVKLVYYLCSPTQRTNSVINTDRINLNIYFFVCLFLAVYKLNAIKTWQLSRTCHYAGSSFIFSYFSNVNCVVIKFISP